VKRVSVDQAFLWSQRFVAREWRLLLPVALAFLALPALLVDLLAPAAIRDVITPLENLQSGTMRVSPAGLALQFVIILLSCAGQLALLALALIPRISVREALGVAFTRLGNLIITGLIFFCLVAVVLVAAVMLLSLTGLAAADMQKIMVGVMLAVMLFLWVRLGMIGPLLVEKALGPVAAISRSWALTRGVFARLLGAIAIYTFGAGVVVFALSSALGTILTLGGKLLGQPETGLVLANVVFRVIVAAAGVGLQVLIVALYRQLSASRSGI
jgi:hypothetical protein